MAAASPYWFRARTYGFGWGIPCAWQGWVVALVWLGACVDGAILLRGEGLVRGLFCVLMFALLLGTCYLKGEPLTWRRSRVDP